MTEPPESEAPAKPLIDPIVQHVAEAICRANGNDPVAVVNRAEDPYPRRMWEFFYRQAAVHVAAYQALREVERDRVH